MSLKNKNKNVILSGAIKTCNIKTVETDKGFNPKTHDNFQ